MTKTYILGKSSALEDSIEFFQKNLIQFGFEIEEKSWLNPVPNVWSVHIQDKNCPLCFTNGKGASKKAALASALGEFFERLSCNYFFADFYLGKQIANAEFVHYPNEKWFEIQENNSIPNGILTKNLWNFYDPEHNLSASDLIDLQSSNKNRGICTLPFIEQKSKQTIYFPMNIIGNLYVSNGMSAGNSQNEARVQALSEIFERFVKNKIITEAMSLPKIPPEILQKYPQIFESIKKIEENGFPLYCFDASLGGKFPVICVVLLNPENGGCFASFGSHPSFEVAFERTVTELLQGRAFNQLNVFPPPSFDLIEVADPMNMETHFTDSSGVIAWDLFKKTANFPFVHWDFSGSIDEEFNTLLHIFYAQNANVFIADYLHLNVPTCRILIPGFSEIYPPSDLIFANNSSGIHLRDFLLNLPNSNFPPEKYLDFVDKIDEEGFDDFTRVREILGIATGKQNAWNSLRIGELKAMLYLAGNDLNSALIWLEWTIDFSNSTFSSERKKSYHCLITLTRFVLERGIDLFDEFKNAFFSLFGKQNVIDLWDYVLGKKRFYGLFSINENLNELEMHQKLLSAYNKLQKAKKIAE